MKTGTHMVFPFAALRRASGFALLLAVNLFAHAQSIPNTYSVSGWWGPAAPKFSPVVSRNGHITFRVRAPKANSVQLRFGEWNIVSRPMTKDSLGAWVVTIGPVEPGIYSYLFSIDGQQSLDLVNPIVKIGTEIYGSIVEVPGITVPRFDQLQPVPHGSLQVHHYPSTPLKKVRRLYVYLPPDYNNSPKSRYPVLYLRHGGGDNESSWTQESGRADIILDNLLAAKKAVPMIIVMSNGLTDDDSWAGGSSTDGMDLLEQELLNDIVPFVEKTFRTLPGPTNRAIAGLSMGGGQAYIMGLRNLHKFSWIGEFSAGLLSDAKFDINERIPGVFSQPASVNKKIKLLFVGCGKDDPRYPGHLNMVESLGKAGIKHIDYSIPGGHEWKVWREELRFLMTKLFQP